MIGALKFPRKYWRAFSAKKNNFLIVCAALLCLALAPLFISADSLVNINTADKATLMTLQGIGEVKAQAIIDYRTTNGPFATIETIMNVTGIGTSTFEAIKNQITVGTTDVLSAQSTSQSAPQTTTQTTTQTSSGSGSQTSSVAPVSRASAGNDRRVLIGTTVRFEGYAYDSSNRRTDEARFQWAFGDGTAAEGRIVTHRYDTPGRYAVVLKATRYESSVQHRITVTVEEPRVSLALLPQGGVSVENKSKDDVDLSLWQLRDGSLSFTFPEGTYLLGGEALTLTVSVLKFYPTANVLLSVPTGDTVATILAEEEPALEEPQQVASSSPDEQMQEGAVTQDGTSDEFESKPLIEESITLSSSEKEKTVESVAASSQVAAPAAAAGTFSLSLLWWGGILALFGLGGAAVFAARRFRGAAPTEDMSTTHVDLKDWDIIDESEEK